MTQPRKKPPIALIAVAGFVAIAAIWILFVASPLRSGAAVGGPLQVLSDWRWILFLAVTLVVLYVVHVKYLHYIESGERAATESAERLAAVVQTVPAGIVMSTPTGVITFMNDQASRLAGIPHEEVIGKELRDVTWDMRMEDGSPFRIDVPPFAAVGEGKAVLDIPVVLMRPRGERVLLDVSAVPMTDERGAITSVIVAVQDVTAVRESEQRIRHLNRIYSMLSQINKVLVRSHDVTRLYEDACRITVEYGEFRMAWIAMLDEATGDVRPLAHAGAEEGYLSAISINIRDEDSGRGPVGSAIRLGKPAVSNDVEHDPTVLLWSKEALKRGYRSIAAFPLREGDRVYGAFAIYADAPGFFDAAETRLLEDLTADISYGVTHIEQNRELDRAMAALGDEVAAKDALVQRLSEDIEARTAAERNLRAANEALDAIVEGSPVPIIATDQEARIVLWNSAAERLFGWTADEVLGRQSPGLSEDALAGQRRMLDVLLTGQRIVNAEQRLPAKDGHPVDLLVSASSVHWPDADTPMAVAVVQDVTELRRVEQLKADFISAVSHELRTPLTSVIGYAGMLRRADASSASVRSEMAQHIDEKAHELQVLIDRLLEAASIQAGATQIAPVPTDPAAFVKEIAAETVVPPGFRLEVSAPGDLPVVRIDALRMEQVLSGLLNNAFKYSPDGGTVRLEAVAEGDRVVFRVSDEGVGIAAEDIARVFDRFTQADMSSTRAVGGLGLGLYLARQVTEAHGGSISLDSTPGVGSTFTISLPVR